LKKKNHDLGSKRVNDNFQCALTAAFVTAEINNDLGFGSKMVNDNFQCVHTAAFVTAEINRDLGFGSKTVNDNFQCAHTAAFATEEIIMNANCTSKQQFIIVDLPRLIQHPDRSKEPFIAFKDS
jgi:hypothetical protein